MKREPSGSGLPWRVAWRIAARELSASRGKFLFIACAIAVGVGSLAGVRSFARSFRTMLLSEARTFLAADLSARVFNPAGAEQLAAMDALAAKGARRTQITEVISMAGREGQSPLLVALKAVDPAAYPFYGQVKMNPPGSLAVALQPDTVAVSDDLLLRLSVRVGDTLRFGEAEFRIAAVIESEPDRMAGSINVGTRVMMSREALARSGLIQPGSRAANRYLFRLDPEKLSLEQARRELRRILPDSMVADFRESHPLLMRGLNRSERFLSLVSLIALIVGAIGVAATMHAHLQQRLDSIAIMKCLGARSSQIVRIYLAQTIAVGLAGGLLGCVVGIGIQVVFPKLLTEYFSMAPRFQWDWVAAAEAISVGLLTAVLFTWPALLGVRKIRPAVIFRRDMPGDDGAWRRRWFASPGPWLAGGTILAALGGIAAWLTGGDLQTALRTGGFFVGALAVSLVVMAGVAWLLLRGVRMGLRRWKLPTTLRHGLANLYRPGNQAQAVLVSLGTGIMFTLTVLLIQRGMLDQLIASAPPNMPNVFLINITSRERDGIERLLRSQAGVRGAPELVGAVSLRIRTVNGAVPVMREERGRRRRFNPQTTVSWRARPRVQDQVVAGKWWDAAKRPGVRQVCVEEDDARALGIAPGAKIAWTAGAQEFDSEVVCTFRSDSVRFDANFNYVFSPGSLDGLPVQYFAGVRMRPADVAGFQRTSFARFPSVTVINAADVIEIVQQVVDQIGLVVRFISTFAILAGVIILASSVAATRFRRLKEVAILKTLGARRRRVAAIFSVEFLVLGALAGLLGSALATGFSNLLLVYLLDAAASFDVAPNLAAVALSAVAANVAGWLSGARILGQKPMEVLRHE